MTTLGYIYGIRHNPESVKESTDFVSTRRVGIELEYENISIHPSEVLDNSLWDVTEDGSLRTINPGTMSLEIRYRTALGGLDSKRALLSLHKYLKRDKGIMVSERTGLHVHVDFRNTSIDQLRNFYIYYLLAEPFLYNFCGAGRDKNIFCMPMYRTLDLVSTHLNLGRFTEKGRLSRNLSSSHKYSGLNLGSLAKKGSVEFRMHPSTVDVTAIKLWINILLKLTEEGTKSKINVRKLIKRAESGVSVVEDIFKEYYQHLATSDSTKLTEIGLESLYVAMCTNSRAKEASAYSNTTLKKSDEYMLDDGELASQAVDDDPEGPALDASLRRMREALRPSEARPAGFYSWSVPDTMLNISDNDNIYIQTYGTSATTGIAVVATGPQANTDSTSTTEED